MEEPGSENPNLQLRKDLLYLLGNLEEHVLSDVLKTLTKLGVDTIEDMQWIEEADLTESLKPVLARKLVRGYKLKMAPSGSSSSESQSTSSPVSPMSFSPKSPSPIMVKVNRDPNWPLKMAIPWDDLSSVVSKALEEGKRLPPSAKRELVNKTVDSIRLKTEHSSRQQIGVIAQRMVAKYPDSLEDKIEGNVCGSGYQSLLEKMIARNENCNRPKSSLRLGLSSKKRPQDGTDTSDEDSVMNKSKQVEKKDSYGCVKWHPIIESDQDYRDMEDAKDKMIVLFSSQDKDKSEVKDLMAKTYALQRYDINMGKSLKELKAQWPYLFQTHYLLSHARELLDIDVQAALCNAYKTKAARLTSFFQGSNGGTCDYFKEAEKQSNMDNLRAWLMAVVLSVLDQFGEKHENMFFVLDETATVDEVEKSVETEDPLLVVLGDSIIAGKTFMLIVDRIIVTNTMHSFLEALATYFAAHYVFNLEYPADTSATLEFIQRCFILINPDKGSKGNKGKKKKRQISPKVLKLVNKLADFEWLDEVN